MRAWPALLITLLACAGRSPQVASSIGAATVTTLDGEQTPIANVIQGHVTLISLWATWCDSCAREVGALNRLSALMTSRKDALVLGVAVGESRASVDRFARDRGLRYPQVVDEDFRFADSLGQREVPATLVVDRTGQIVFRGRALDGAGLAAFRDTLGPLH